MARRRVPTGPARAASRRRARGATALVAAVALVLVACGGPAPAPRPAPPVPTTASPAPAPTPAPTAPTPGVPTPTAPAPLTPPPTQTSPSTPATPTHRPTNPAPPADPLAGMTLAQKVGQLFLVGAPVTGSTAATATAVRTYHAGGVVLVGRSTAGVAATRALVDRLQADRSPADRHPLLVAVDQEGGNIQVLRGPGFPTMPTALTQGKQSPASLRADARTWGDALHRAGVDLDLAPVMDVVPSPADNAANAPVGYWHRQYGYTPAAVVSHANAFADGLRDAGVGTTVKHFPGLGRVTGNTDFTSGVTDTVTTATSPQIQVFADGIANHPTAVMTSTAIYSHLDPGTPAAFSHDVVTGLLRGTLGWKGLVVTDDLSKAKQVAAWTPGQRAVDAIAAGNDVVLAGTAGQVPAMTAAVVARATADPAFARLVDAAVRRVLAAKASVAG